MKKLLLFAVVIGFVISFSSISEAADKKVRLTSLEESPSLIEDWVVENIIAAEMETLTVDYDCFSFPECRKQVVKIKKALPNIVIRVYGNPMELFDRTTILDQRPIQKAIWLEVGSTYQDYYLHDKNGERVVFWQQPDKDIFMEMMNLSSLCPKYSHKSWGMYWVDKVYEKVYLPNKDLVDGLEIDNLWPYVSFVNEMRDVEIDLDNDGKSENLFLLDYHWREGINEMIAYARTKFPKDFVITGRGFQYRYADKVDGLTMEEVFMNGDALQGGNYAKVERWLRHTTKMPYTTLNERVTWGEPVANISNYVICLLGDGYCGFDAGGSSEHGSFEPFDGYIDLGQPTGKVIYPYNKIFDLETDAQHLSGGKIQSDGTVRLDPGQKAMFVLPSGEFKVNFYYEVHGGRYEKSFFNFFYSGKKTKDGPLRWVDGEVYQDVKAPQTGIVSWEYKGPGYAVIKWIKIHQTDKTTRHYFSRTYEKGVVVYNPITQPIGINLKGGTQLRLEPGQGKILLYQ